MGRPQLKLSKAVTAGTHDGVLDERHWQLYTPHPIWISVTHLECAFEGCGASSANLVKTVVPSQPFTLPCWCIQADLSRKLATSSLVTGVMYYKWPDDVCAVAFYRGACDISSVQLITLLETQTYDRAVTPLYASISSGLESESQTEYACQCGHTPRKKWLHRWRCSCGTLLPTIQSYHILLITSMCS